MQDLPVIDVAPLRHGSGAAVAGTIGEACRTWGFFYVVGHGVDEGLQRRLEQAARRFFDLPLEAKMRVRMERGGRAWRGYFPVGGELTSGRPDLKEGIYFGAELGDDHPLVRRGTPLHGGNLFPPEVPELRDAVLAFMEEMTRLGHLLMEGIALSLGLERQYFEKRYTADPLVLFRIFHYPAAPPDEPEQWGVGEHTDYGLLTILKQDETGGLEVRAGREWVAAPPIPGSFVCNLGDMLDRMTGGRYRSTPHRVRNVASRGRLSFPFFFDPAWEARVQPIPTAERVADDRHDRWDQASVHEFGGTYGEYVLGKVGKVFPQLLRDVL